MERSLLYFQVGGRSVATTVEELLPLLGDCPEPMPTLPVVAILRDNEDASFLPPGCAIYRHPSTSGLAADLLGIVIEGGLRNELAEQSLGPLPVPDSASATQIRLWLHRAGVPVSQVEEAIASIADEGQRTEAMIRWEYSPYIERHHPLVAAIASRIGMSDADVDAAFLEAASL